LTGAEALVRQVSAAEASQLAGVRLTQGGLYFPTAGWLSPPALCQALADHPRIHVHTHTQALGLELTDGKWQLHTAAGDKPLHAAVAVIANARDALALAQTGHLPLKSIRGQVSYLAPGAEAKKLKAVICGEGYLAPPLQLASGNWQQCVGASFNLHDTSSQLSAVDHRANLDKLAPLVPDLASEWSQINTLELPGRVGFRCTSPDYLPLVGPVPVEADFLRDYAPLRKDARR